MLPLHDLFEHVPTDGVCKLNAAKGVYDCIPSTQIVVFSKRTEHSPLMMTLPSPNPGYIMYT